MNEVARGNFEDAVVKSGIRLARSRRACLFCGELRVCLSWVPECLNQTLPICETCFHKLGKAFGRVSGGLIWEDTENEPC
jgi:hypothetical protein